MVVFVVVGVVCVLYWCFGWIAGYVCTLLLFVFEYLLLGCLHVVTFPRFAFAVVVLLFPFLRVRLFFVGLYNWFDCCFVISGC